MPCCRANPWTGAGAGPGAGVDADAGTDAGAGPGVGSGASVGAEGNVALMPRTNCAKHASSFACSGKRMHWMDDNGYSSSDGKS